MRERGGGREGVKREREVEGKREETFFLKCYCNFNGGPLENQLLAEGLPSLKNLKMK